jgi:predicted lipoprotein with Yx(FWY)xxD motif
MSYRIIPMALAALAAVAIAGCGSSHSSKPSGSSGSSSASSSSSGAYGSSGYGAYGSSSSSSSSKKTKAASSSGVAVKVAKTSAGQVLTDSAGYTLYVLTADGHDRSTCATESGCTGVWPLATVSGKPVAGTGVNSSLLGVITVDGKHELTYDGHPLYTFVGDSAPGQVKGIGIHSFGGVWYAISPAGSEVK